MAEQSFYRTNWGKIRKIVLEAAPAVYRSTRDLILKLKLESLGAKILVVGNTGTGKTALVRNLLASEPLPEPPDESTKYSEEIIGKNNVILVDTPGNRPFVSELNKQLEQVGAGRFLGVLNVVAAGYNDSLARSVKEDDTPAYLDDGSLNESFLREWRDDDLKFLNDWFLSQRWLQGRVGWMITAINKYDLWNADESNVMAYYGKEGEYGKKIADIIGRANYFTVAVCAAEPTRTAGRFRGRTIEDILISHEELTIRNSKFLNVLGECVAEPFPHVKGGKRR